MLRKEILGTKVRTESGLNKPLTLVKPNNDEDYKNQEFLDTDILLAKDIKRFVKGGGASGDTSSIKYTYETQTEEYKYNRNVIIDTRFNDDESFYNQCIQLNDIFNGVELGSIKIGNSQYGYGIEVYNYNGYNDTKGFDIRGPLNSMGNLYPYHIINNDLSKYEIHDGKWNNQISNDGTFPINNPIIFTNLDRSEYLFRYIYVNDFDNIDLEYNTAYKYKVDTKSCIVDAFVADLNEYGINYYYNVGGIKSVKSLQSNSKVFATDGSIVDLPVVNTETQPTLPEFSSNGNVMYANTNKSKYKGFCYYVDPSDANYLNCIGSYLFGSGTDSGFYKQSGIVNGTSSCHYKMFPMFDTHTSTYKQSLFYGYQLYNIHSIRADVKGLEGYYKSDGTIVSIDALKKELDITDSGNFSKPIIAYISSSEDASAEEIYKNRSLLDVAFTAYVNNVGNTGSFTVGAYCNASDEYTPTRYYLRKKDPGYNDTFIFPMFDINNSHETFISENIDYTLRNISGIKSDDGNIGYYCSDGTVTTLDDLRTAIGTGVNISNTSTITLSQEGKSSTMNLAYSGITLNQYLTSSTNPGQCKGNISGGALRLIRAYTNASGVTDLSNPDYTIYLKTDDASIRGYDKNNNGYVLTNRNQVVTIDGNDVTLNVPLLYLSGNDNNRFLATGDHLAIGDFKNTENVNNARLFVKEYVNGSYKTGLQLQGFSNNNTLPIKVGLFINNEENSSTRCGVFMENKTQNDLITANGGTKAIGVDIAAQSSITELQSQIKALTARIAALEAKQ